jgi:hypothetical protein
MQSWFAYGKFFQLPKLCSILQFLKQETSLAEPKMENLTTTVKFSSSRLVSPDAWSFPWIPKLPWLLTTLVAYPLIQQYLRYQRLNAMKKKYNYPNRQALAKMTDNEAWEIMNNLAELEFCTMFEKGMPPD